MRSSRHFFFAVGFAALAIFAIEFVLSHNKPAPTHKSGSVPTYICSYIGGQGGAVLTAPPEHWQIDQCRHIELSQDGKTWYWSPQDAPANFKAQYLRIRNVCTNAWVVWPIDPGVKE